MDTAKGELNAALSAKANANEVNNAIEELRTAILNAEAASKAYADEKDTALAASVQEKINSAKSETVNAAKTALDTAVNNLNAAISAKANANEVNDAIEEVRTAIVNAEAVSKAYADEKDTALKTEFEEKIAQADDRVTAAISALSERLDAVESRTDTLQVVLVVFIILFSLVDIAAVVIYVLRNRK